MQTQHLQAQSSQGLDSPQSGYVVSVESQPYLDQTAENNQLSSQEIAVASVGLLLLISVTYFVRRRLKQRKADEAELGNTNGSLSKARRLTSFMPCTKCHYFKANMYLPCAVNPTVALKPEAENCGDYRPRDGSEYSEVTG